MDPLGTNMYLLKRYRTSDRFYTFISESVQVKGNGYWSTFYLLVYKEC